MSKKLIFFAVVLLLFNILNSCDEWGNNAGEIKGELIDHSECKFLKSAHNRIIAPISDSISCISYTFSASENKLSLQHINAAFNCCPDEIRCKFQLEDNTLLVEESEKSADCDCNCLFDLDMEISGVEEKTYTLKIAEPYVDQAEWIQFELDLKKETVGFFCVTRKQYPWGLESSI